MAYVGSSINLYNRVFSYFYPSILTKSDRKVLRYFNKYGINDVKLTLLILESSSNWEQVIELEQYCIDLLSPNLNVDLVAGGYYGYHNPMSQASRNLLRQLRGTPIYIYDTLTTSLIFISESKQWLFLSIGIHHLTLNNSILNGSLYLNRFLFSLDVIVEYYHKNVLNSKEFIDLIELVKSKHKPFQPASKKILAENIHNPKLNHTFSSIGELTKYLKGDKSTIRNYIEKKSTGLYRKQWKFTLIKSKSNNK
jgi:hypothetical protein